MDAEPESWYLLLLRSMQPLDLLYEGHPGIFLMKSLHGQRLCLVANPHQGH